MIRETGAIALPDAVAIARQIANAIAAAGAIVCRPTPTSNYDVARDGRLLQVLQIQPSKAHTRIEVVLNEIGK